MSQKGRKIRQSMVSTDSTPLRRFHGFLKKKGRGKRWGVLNNEYLLLYMGKIDVSGKMAMPEPRSKYNVKQIDAIRQKGNAFELRFHDGTTRDFQTDNEASAKEWVDQVKERMGWFRGLVNAADSHAKMEKAKKLADLEQEVEANKKETDKLKSEAKTKMDELSRMAKELEDKERELKERSMILERKMTEMRKQQESAKHALQKWESQIEEKEGNMLERADGLRKKVGKSMVGMLSRAWKRKSTSSSSLPPPVKVTTPAQLEGKDAEKLDTSNSSNEVMCPETGDAFTLSPVGLRFRVDCKDASRAGNLSARRASAAVGTLRTIRRMKRQGLLKQSASTKSSKKARELLGVSSPIPEEDEESSVSKSAPVNPAEAKKVKLCSAISECIGLATMENMAKVSRGRLASDSPTAAKKRPTDGDDVFQLPLNFDEVCGYKISDETSVKDHAPSVFSSLRSLYGINDKDFVRSMGTLSGGDEGEGKSKMLFFMSKDKNYVMKTVKSHELEFFWELLKDYYWHMVANPDTLLCRFFGLYTVTYTDASSTRKFHLVVMNNTFQTTWKIQHKFDLKGSINNRIVPPDQVHKVSVLKDLNLGQRHVWLPKDEYEDLSKQLKVDTWFLERNNIMDYSLLLGISEALDRPPKKTTGKQFSRWQTDGGGMLCSRGACRRRADARDSSHECYVLSIIDILQQFTWKKQAESVWKQQKYGSEVQISCVDAETYAARFRDFMTNTVFQKYRWLRRSLQKSDAPGRPTMRTPGAGGNGDGES